MLTWNPKFLFYFKPLIRASRNINWRFGKPFRWKDFDIRQIHQFIHPGMVILSRKEHHLANYFIPGYWTHTAMVIPEGKVVEATGEGVILNEIWKICCHADDFVFLKPRFCDRLTMEKACGHAIETLGRPYSFDFSLSDDRIYCSALVYLVYMKSCGLAPESPFLPDGFSDLFEGKIVSPDDLYRNRKAWEVVFQAN